MAHSRRERALVRAHRLHLTPTRTLTLTLTLTRCELTGFTRDEAIGNTCRMLQGPATCSQALGALEAALKRRQPLTLRLLNYDATRTPFMNTLQA